MANGTSTTKGGGTAQAAQATSSNGLAPHGEFETKLLGLMYPQASSNEEAREMWIKDNTQVDPSKALVTGKAIQKFTGAWSSEIRDSQKAGLNDEAGKMGDLLEDYIQKSPQWDNSHDLHRGVGLPPAVVDSILQGIKTGKTFDVNNSGTASWSTKYDVSEGFANAAHNNIPVIFRSKTMKNATSIEHMTSIHGEHEVLSSKKNNFRPIKATPKNIHGHKGWLIDVEEL